MNEHGARASGGGRGQDSARDTRLRQMVRTGVTSFALLGGISCYVLLLQFRLVTQPVAVVIGLVFALLVRIAAGSLARDWLQQQLARRDGETPRTNGVDSTRRSGRGS
jgi:hypothetical protein